MCDSIANRQTHTQIKSVISIETKKFTGFMKAYASLCRVMLPYVDTLKQP